MAEMEHPQEGHETSDVQAGGVIRFGIGLIVLVVVVFGVVAWLQGIFVAEAERGQKPLPPLAASERLSLPKNLEQIPEPRLQKDEIQDLESFRRKEDEKLNFYGWIDRKAGKLRIPIDRAMELMADPEKARARGIESRKKMPKEER